MTPAATNGVTEHRTIPFDYSFKVPLSGDPNQQHVATVDVSVEAPFTAVSMGYGVVCKEEPITFAPRPPISQNPKYTLERTLSSVTLDSVLHGLYAKLSRNDARNAPADLEQLLAGGIRINPACADFVTSTSPGKQLPLDVWNTLFQQVTPEADVQFLYALFDQGTGRAFQSDPILNIAGLGAQDGRRPFRPFATPIVFAPRSTIRLEITECSSTPADLYVTLHGFRTLGAAGTPTGRVHRRRHQVR